MERGQREQSVKGSRRRRRRRTTTTTNGDIIYDKQMAALLAV
jgi:hypothetical protein